MMSSHLFFAADLCIQIAKHIMINDLQMMEAHTIQIHVVYVCVCLHVCVHVCICLYVHMCYAA